MSRYRLLLIRHAKSSWDYPELDDHERPLNRRGLRDVPVMTERLQRRDTQLQIVFSSSAVRALAIAESIGRSLAIPVISEYALYTFSADDLLDQLTALPDRYRRVAVVGHNPAITSVANRLSGESIANVPTTGIVSLACDIDGWRTLAADTCSVEDFDYPKRVV